MFNPYQDVARDSASGKSVSKKNIVVQLRTQALEERHEQEGNILTNNNS
jgi:hypothetical protein